MQLCGCIQKEGVKVMKKINHNIDRLINWSEPESIDNYAPEDQFEYLPNDQTIKDIVINFLLDYIIDPIRMFLIKQFNIFHYKQQEF